MSVMFCIDLLICVELLLLPAGSSINTESNRQFLFSNRPLTGGISGQTEVCGNCQHIICVFLCLLIVMDSDSTSRGVWLFATFVVGEEGISIVKPLPWLQVLHRPWSQHMSINISVNKPIKAPNHRASLVKHILFLAEGWTKREKAAAVILQPG